YYSKARNSGDGRPRIGDCTTGTVVHAGERFAASRAAVGGSFARRNNDARKPACVSRRIHPGSEVSRIETLRRMQEEEEEEEQEEEQEDEEENGGIDKFFVART